MSHKPYNLGARGVVQSQAVLVTYADDTDAVTFPDIPEGALVLDCYPVVGEVFNDTGTDLLTMGVNGAVTRGFSALDIAALGVKNPTVTPFIVAADEVVQCVYTGSNTDATTGIVQVIVEFMTIEDTPSDSSP